MSTSTQKRTFTIKNDFAKKLNTYKNKSQIVNNALKLYFSREQYLKNADEEFFKTFELEEFTNEQLNSLKSKWKSDYDKLSFLID